MSTICKSVTLRCFTEETDVSFISEALGVLPTHTAIKGSLMSPRNPRSQIHTSSLWTLESVSPHGTTIDEHCEELLLCIETHFSAFQKIQCRLTDVDFFCYIHADGEQIGLILSKILIKRIVSIGGSIELDVYAEMEGE